MLTENMCRVCLCESNELTPLRVMVPGAHKTLEETINFVANINITLEDGLPDKICKECGTMLDVADTFKQRVLVSEAILSSQLGKGKGTDESRPSSENKGLENSEIYSEDTSYLPTVTSCPSLSDSLLKEIKNEQNMYDYPEYKIKMEIVENYVGDEIATSEQENLDMKQDFGQLCIKEEGPDKPDNCSDNEDCYLETMKHTQVLCYSCKECGRDFPSGESLESHQLEHSRKDARGPKNLDDIHPVSAQVTSTTEDQRATDSSTASSSQTEGTEKTKITIILAKNKRGKYANLGNTEEMVISTNETSKDIAQNTANALTLPASNTDDKITCAVKQHSKCISNTTGNTSGAVLTCDICEYTTDQIKYLNSHLKANAATKRYSCDSSSYLTTRLSSYKNHVSTHAKDKLYSCDVCEKNLSNKSAVVTHMRTHTGDKPYSCNVCGKKFSVKSSVLIHMRTHTGDKPYSCDVCEKKFNQKQHLNSHMITHTGDKPYSCNVCEKKFNRNSDLSIHMRIHTGDKPYSCNVCEKKYSRKSALIIHMRIHTGDKHYSCNVCEKKFSRKSDLIIHMRIHTGDKPYSCIECGNKFRRKQHLESHIKLHK